MNNARTQGNIFVISAPSGCGKTTIVSGLLSGEKNIERSISATTRPARKGEKHGRDYYFVSERSFVGKVKSGKFLEWAKNFGYYYGTPGDIVSAKLKKGIDIILTIDVKGAAQVKKKIPGSVMVFIMPPKFEDLEIRLHKRATDGDGEIRNRLCIARKEMAYSKNYDYIIVNDKLDEAVKHLKAIVIAKRCENNKRK